MASLDDVLKGNLRGFRRETGQPAEEIAVEEPAIDEVEPPQLYDERAEYRGFKVPAGMDAEQTERWFGAIDAREDEREAAEAEAEAEFEAESGFTTQLLGSLERTVMKDNPRMGAKAVEGLGRVAGSQAMIDFGSKTAAEYDTSDDPAAFSPRIESIYDAEGFQDYIDYAGSTLGQGVASIGTMVAGGVAGAAAGAPLGLSGVTAPVGAFTAGFIQNYGDLYDTLVEQEGMDPNDAAKYALIPAGIMGALDTTGVIKIVKPARDGLSRNLVKRTAQLAIRGGGNEAVTEAAQQVVQESAGEIAEVTGLATKDIEFSQRFENVVNALVAGFIPGFTLGGASAVRVRPEDDAPAPPAAPAPEEIVSANMEDVAAEVPDAATAGAETESEIAEARRLWQELGIESPYFKRKFGNTKVTDDDGKPLAVFHGTSGDFDQFRPGSPEGAFGSAIYTSSSSDDVNVNYATAEGSDIKNRVDQAIDSIDSLDDFDDDDILDAAKRYMDRTESTDTELLEAIKAGDVEKLKDELEPDLIEQLARQQVLGDEAFSVLKTYVNIENPVYLDPSGTKGRTTFDLEIEYDDDGEFVGESGSVLELLEAIDEVADDLSTYQIGGRGPYSDDVDKLKTFIGENSIDGEIDALDLFEEVRGGNYYFESDTGGLENTEFIRKVFEKMGFDGIVADAYHFFGDRKGFMGARIPAMAGVTPGTYHYMAFKPEQIKSATGNVGTFDPSGNILRQSATTSNVIGFGDLSAYQAIDEIKKVETGMELIDFIVDRADNPAYKVIAERIRPFLDKTMVATISKIEDVPRSIMLAIDDGDLEASTFDLLLDMSRENTRTGTRGVTITTPEDVDIVLRGHADFSGATAEVALHEAIHAATQNRIADGQLKQNRKTELGKATAELAALHKRVKKILKKRKTQKGSAPADPKLFDVVLEYGLEDLNEFVSYGMTNKTFQDFLMSIESENKSLWNTFVEKVANLLGIENQTVLTDLIRVTDQILSADVEELPARVRTRFINRMLGSDQGTKPSLLGGSNPVFESELEKIILNQTPNKIGVDDIEQFLNKKGAKKSEIADTKIAEFVAAAKAEGKKSVTKDELIQHLEDDKVQIKEVRLDRNRREAPQYLKDAEIAADEAFKDIYDEVKELASIMDPNSSVTDVVHKYSNNPNHFFDLYVDYVGDLGDLDNYVDELLDPDVYGPVKEVVDLVSEYLVSEWTIDDVKLITKAANVVSAKLSDLKYNKFIDEQRRFLSESRLNNFSPAIVEGAKSITEYQNLQEIDRIFLRMGEVESRFLAFKKFSNIPNVKKYLKLKKQYLKQEKSFFKEDKRFNPRWDSWTIPEGENYQEILITVPMSPKEKRARAEVKRLNLAEVDLALEQETVRGSFLQPDLPLSPEMQNITDELRLAESNLKKVQSKPFDESHHGDFPNVMVHIRTKDRIDSKGRKILFVEEIQSDWHQKGRKRGYTQEENDAKRAEATDKLLDLEAARNEAYRMPDGQILNERHTISDEEYTARNEAYKEGEKLVRKQKNLIVEIRKGPVPDAPLKDTKEWMSLAIKRIFREASEQGYDGVAFTRSDLITPIVSLSPDVRLDILTSGDPANALMLEIELLKKSTSGSYDNLGEEVERIYGGNKYIYDKLIPSIAKKESKAKQETTYIEMMETGFSKVGKPRTPGGPPRTEVMQTTLDRLVRDGGVVEVPFFELTDKVKDRVSKPQKLYSLALPALVVGAAASEEEELSPAAALMSLGKAGMALYRKLTGSDEEGNPAEELAPMRLSERSYSPVDSIVTYTDVGQSKAEFDRRREMANKYEPMLFELMKMEADFYEMDEDSDKAKELGARYEDLLKQYEKIDDDLFSDEYERFLKGTDYYYETSEEGIENFDVDRAFNVMNPGSDIEMDINLRTTQEMMQRKRFDRMMERGGTLVDLAGQNSSINRLIVQKAQAFNHPVQTVQLNESDKMFLEKDLSNLEELKEDGLISYLLYKELKGDVMLF
jgi:hypothetical protein